MESQSSPAVDLESEFARFVQRGDVEALARVFDATSPGLLSVARHLVRGGPEAEDLVQATFLTAIERASAFDTSRNLLAWLTGILALHARKHLRQSGRELDPERLPGREAEDPHRAAQGAEVAAAVERAMGDLPERYAGVLRLHLRDQLAPREIARRLGIDAGTARVQLHRGLKMLRETLPAGLGGFGVVPLPTSGLSAVREAVLARGAQYTVTSSGAVAVVAAGTSWPLLLLAATALAVLGGLAIHATRGAPRPADPSALAALALPESAPPPTGLADPVDSEAVAPPHAASRVQAPPAPAPAAGRGDTARVSGRLLLPDGEPAVGAEVKLHGWNANQDRVLEFPPPADWKDPVPVRTDADGRFAIDVVPPRAFQFTVGAEFAGHAQLKWRWGEIAPGARIDVGERSFQAACTVRVRVLGQDGSPLATRFQVHASPGRSGWRDGTPADVIEPIIVNARFDESSGEYVLEGLPPGPAEVQAKSDLTDWLKPRNVVAAPGDPQRVDLKYEGPDPSTRIVLTWSSRPFHTFDPDLAHVHLKKDGADPIAPKKLDRTPSSASFDGLGAGPYTVEIDDPRFERFVQTGVETGTRVRAKLRGNAALAVVLKRGDEQVEAEPERLTLTYLDSQWFPNEFDLRQPTLLPVVDGYLTGIVPGRCELRVGVKGLPETRVALGELKPGERRRVVVDLGGTRTLRGIVLDAEGGKPSKGVVVLLTRGARAGHGLGKGATVGANGGSIPAADFTATTGTDGRFVFEGLQPGTHTLRAAWSEWLYADRTIEIGEEPPAELSFVAPPSGSLDVELILPDGAVHDGVDLSLYRRDELGVEPQKAYLSLHHREALVPGAVHATSPLAPGRYLVGALVRTGGMSNSFGEVEVDVVAGPRTPVRLDLSTTMPGRLRLGVLLGDEMTDGEFVEIVRVSGDKRGTTGRSIGPDGKVLLGGVAPGRVRLSISGPERRWAWTDPREIEIAPGQEIALEIAVPIVQRTLTVRDAGGALVADAEILVLAGETPAAVETRVKTDASGHVRLGLPAGAVHVRIQGAEAVKVEWSADRPEPFEVRLPRP